jgi:hypothetical protein
VKLLSGSGIEKLAAYFTNCSAIDSNSVNNAVERLRYDLNDSDYSKELKESVESSIPKKSEDVIPKEHAEGIEWNTNYLLIRKADFNYRFDSIQRKITEKEMSTLLQYAQMLEADVAEKLNKIKEAIEWHRTQKGVAKKIAWIVANNITCKNERNAVTIPEGLHECEAEVAKKLIDSMGTYTDMEAAYELAKIEVDRIHERDVESFSRITHNFGEDLGKAAEEIAKISIKGGLESVKSDTLKKTVIDSMNEFLESPDCGIAKKDEKGNLFLDAEKAKELAYRPYRRMGLDLEAIAEGRTFTFNFDKRNAARLDPYAISRQCIDDYTSFCFSLANSGKEKKKIGAAKRVFDNDSGLILEECMGALSKNARQEIRAAIGAKKPKKAYGLLSENEKEKVEEIMMKELSIFLNSKPKSGKAKAFELVCEKWSPEWYFMQPEEKPIVKLEGIMGIWGMELDIVPDIYKKAVAERKNNGLKHLGYTAMLAGYIGILPVLMGAMLPAEIIWQITNRKYAKEARERKKALREQKMTAPKLEAVVTRDAKLIQKAALATNASCIRHQPLNNFEKNAKDPGTLHIVIKQDGMPRGYARAYLMETEKHEAVIGIDTLEPPEKSFREHPEMINAMCLSFVQIGLDIGAKYVVCNDARMRAGAQDAFGRTERRIKAVKIGRRDVHQYQMQQSLDSDVFVLMQNWRK